MTQSGSTGPGAGSGWAPPPAPIAQPGPQGFVYADVPNRAIAYIIDAIVLGIIGLVIFAVLTAAGLSIISGIGTGLTTNYGVSLIYAIVGLVISGGYFWYTWTRMRGTLGMKALGMQIGNAVDGKTITNEQAIRRWIALGAPFSLAQALNPIGGIGNLLGLLAFLWFIYLLYTTAKSPTKQGFHDVFANTMVVKAARIA
jgi:uncharacterized RDD family membrane protein YckC